jgi:hypothetical protein
LERVVGRQRGIAVAGAHESDRADGIGLEMPAQALVEREERWLP